MSVFETGAEELAYERGFEHGEESGIFIGESRAEERIIKVLQGRAESFASHYYDTDGLIALINGKPE